jgi:HlyD family secretion protein
VIKKKWVVIGIFGLLLLTTTILLYRLHSPIQSDATTIAVTRNTITEKAEAVGYIKPKQPITVKSQINGIVADIYHEEGDFIKKGTPLLKVNPAPSPTEYATTRQQVEEAIEKEKSASQDLQRYQKALKKQLISPNFTQYIQAKKTYETEKLNRVLAEQRLALIEKGQTYIGKQTIANVVVSPIDGFILNRAVNKGDPVLSIRSAQASTPLFMVASMQDLIFEGIVDETHAAKIQIGTPAQITVGAFSENKIDGKLAHIALQSEKENAQHGIKQTISENESPFNVGFKVKITNLKVPANLKLRSGYSATADIHIKTAKDVLTLPIRVVHFDNHQPYVMLPASNKKSHPTKRLIKTGLSDHLSIEIKSGLKLGDRVLDTPEKPTDNEED